MPKRQRKPREHTQEWQTLKHYTLWPEQQAHKLLRPVVLFGDPVIGWAKETAELSNTARDRRHYFGKLVRAFGLRCWRTTAHEKCSTLSKRRRQRSV